MVALALGSLLVPAHARQIAVPDWEGSVSFELVASQDRARPGDRLELAVLARIDPGYHLYGPKERKPSRTEITPLPVEGLSFGEPVFPPVVSRDLAGLGKYDLYEGRAVFRVPLGVAPEAVGRKEFQIQLKVSYQVCTDYACSAPTWRTLSLVLPLAPPGASVRPVHPEVFTDNKSS